MKNYILKLTSGTTYKLYDGTTLVSDADLTTLFATAGSAYLSFDFDDGTPTSTDEFTITNSSDTAVITNTGLTDAIEENKNYKVTWSASATAFDTLEALGGVSMDESQLSSLMGKIKGAGGGSSPIEAFVPTAATVDAVSIDPGTYVWASGTNSTYTIRCGSQNESVHDGDIFVVRPAGSIGYTDKTISVLKLEGRLHSRFGWAAANGSWDTEYQLYPTSNLTTSSAGNFLDAVQGYRLNQKIMGQQITAQGTPLAWAAIGIGSSYTKRALQVTLNISETGLTIPADTWTSLGITMPTNYRPTITMLGSVTANNNGTFEAGLIRVNTDGTVEVHTSNATTDIYGSIVFPVAS